MLSLCGGLRVEQKIESILVQSIGETIGEIPLYSLHRIRTTSKKTPIDVSDEINILLSRNLIIANQEYKEETGKNWSCLTSNNLVSAIENTDEQIKVAIDGINDIPKEYAHIRDLLLKRLHSNREEGLRRIKVWFEENFENIRYIMDGKIPWPIICRLRKNLGMWIANASNPFGENIGDVILDVAAEQGIRTEDPDVAWEKMGGKIFR